MRTELAQLCEDVYLATRSDPPRSVVLGRAAVRLARGSSDAAALGLAARSLGHAWRAVADYRRALSAYAASDRAYELAGQNVERARNAIGKLDALMYLGRYDEALSEARQAEEIFIEAGEEIRLVGLRANLGSLYYRLDRYAEAAASYESSLPVFEAHGDEDRLANTRLNLAIVKSSMLRFDEAAELFVRAAEYYRKTEMRMPEALIEYNLGCLDHLCARYSSALQRLERAAKMLGDDSDPSLLASCRLEEAQVFLSLAMAREAGQAAREAAHLFEVLSMRAEQAKCLSCEGVALALDQQPRPALQVLGRALELFRGESNSVLGPALPIAPGGNPPPARPARPVGGARAAGLRRAAADGRAAGPGARASGPGLCTGSRGADVHGACDPRISDHRSTGAGGRGLFAARP